jgi:lysyl-tRNA synthetase class I
MTFGNLDPDAAKKILEASAAARAAKRLEREKDTMIFVPSHCRRAHELDDGIWRIAEATKTARDGTEYVYVSVVCKECARIVHKKVNERKRMAKIDRYRNR